MASFSPSGYGYRFDAFANVLASLLGVADDTQCNRVDAFIAEEINNADLPLLPAFHPVIEPVDEDWEELQVMFSYTFKNKPYEFQNGGLWPMVTGFYVVDLARRQVPDIEIVVYLIIRFVGECNGIYYFTATGRFPVFFLIALSYATSAASVYHRNHIAVPRIPG